MHTFLFEVVRYATFKSAKQLGIRLAYHHIQQSRKELHLWNPPQRSWSSRSAARKEDCKTRFQQRILGNFRTLFQLFVNGKEKWGIYLIQKINNSSGLIQKTLPLPQAVAGRDAIPPARCPGDFHSVGIRLKLVQNHAVEFLVLLKTLKKIIVLW